MAAVIAARSAETRRRQRDSAEAEVQQEAAAAGGGGAGARKLMMGKQKHTVPEGDVTLRDRMWTALDDPSSSRPAYSFSVGVLLLIILSCTAFVVETIPSMCCGRYDQIWSNIESVCVTVFSVEYIIRIAIVPPRTSNEGMFSVLPEVARPPPSRPDLPAECRPHRYWCFGGGCDEEPARLARQPRSPSLSGRWGFTRLAPS